MQVPQQPVSSPHSLSAYLTHTLQSISFTLPIYLVLSQSSLTDSHTPLQTFSHPLSLPSRPPPLPLSISLSQVPQLSVTSIDFVASAWSTLTPSTGPSPNPPVCVMVGYNENYGGILRSANGGGFWSTVLLGTTTTSQFTDVAALPKVYPYHHTYRHTYIHKYIHTYIHKYTHSHLFNHTHL